MCINNLKTHYSAKELLDFSLACLPNSVQGIIYQAKKNNWKTQKRVGKGGGVEYALCSLPQHLQDEIRNKFAVTVVKSKPKAPLALRQVELKTLTEKQRETVYTGAYHDCGWGESQDSRLVACLG
ncbi:hypothetical protein BKK49_00365 [Rodentibacter rarus]|uniref:HTH Mu-type domain-containing protein n=1 Tax=Rodentibacter rarus TaxID=1908260 RepID=A0A1V3IHL5_9PAST|nr:DNA-binding protein [Rodentibacter rarus]OOF40647.1 hypothetical protein BKK50_09470 [Rodentibacter rarus]OOF43390.1 hypothetical protein BKK49_00365 [Rodentibacter rarus]